MAKIIIEALKPQVAKVKIAHPITGDTEFALPDGTLVPLEIHLVGRNSKQWLDFMRSIQTNAEDTRESLFSKINDASRDFVAALIVGWTENGALNEPYSPESALELVSDPDNIWILDQLQNAIITESNFFLVNSAE
jgi:hypothetical protein